MVAVAALLGQQPGVRPCVVAVLPRKQVILPLSDTLCPALTLPPTLTPIMLKFGARMVTPTVNVTSPARIWVLVVSCST